MTKKYPGGILVLRSLEKAKSRERDGAKPRVLIGRIAGLPGLGRKEGVMALATYRYSDSFRIIIENFLGISVKVLKPYPQSLYLLPSLIFINQKVQNLFNNTISIFIRCYAS